MLIRTTYFVGGNNENKVPLRIILSVLHFALILIFCVNSHAEEGCKRQFYLKKHENLHLPPDFVDNLANQKITEDTNYILPRQVEARLAEVFTTDRFRLVRASESMLQSKRPPLYYFESSFEVHEEWVDIGGGERRHPSTFILNLYFDGETKELVKTWRLERKSPNSVGALNAMFDNRNSLTKKDVPIDLTIISPFEKIPESCEIKPEKEEIEFGKKMKIQITNFKDIEGVQSREFNRVLVTVIHGEILNGAHPQEQKNYAFFQVGEGTIEVEYKAPEACPEISDTIQVIQSCDIFRKSDLPLEESDAAGTIAEKEIFFRKPGATLRITMEYRTNTDIDEKPSPIRHNKRKWNESYRISIIVHLDENPDIETRYDAVRGFSPREYRYKVLGCTLSSASFSASGSNFASVRGAFGIANEVDTSSTETGTFHDSKPSQRSIDFVIRFDENTGKPNEVLLPPFEVELKINGKTTGNKKERKTVGGFLRLVTTPIDRSYIRRETVYIQSSCVEGGSGNVNKPSGDDINSGLIGNGTRTIKQKYGTAFYSYRWEMIIQKK